MYTTLEERPYIEDTRRYESHQAIHTQLTLPSASPQRALHRLSLLFLIRARAAHRTRHWGSAHILYRYTTYMRCTLACACKQTRPRAGIIIFDSRQVHSPLDGRI